MAIKNTSHGTMHLIVALLLGLLIGYGATTLISKKNAALSPAQCALRTAMRRLWSDHVAWTRNYVISAIANLEDLQTVTDRLLQNQADIGAALATYYSPDVGVKVTALLKEHIVLAGKVLAAAKANNSAELAKENEQWYKNAQDIAKALSSINSEWSYDSLVKMLNMHLKLLTDEVTARLKKDWKNDVIAFDESMNEILNMADQLTSGIVAQFPTKF